MDGMKYGLHLINDEIHHRCFLVVRPAILLPRGCAFLFFWWCHYLPQWMIRLFPLRPADPFTIFLGIATMHLFPFLLAVFTRKASFRQAREVLSLSTRLQSSSVETIGERLPQSKYDALLDWIKEQEGSEIHPSIELRPSTLGDGYGAFVSSAVNEGDLLFAIPRSACVTLEIGMDDPECGPTYRKLIEKAGPGGNTVVLAGFLATERLRSLEYAEQMREKGESVCADSVFAPYLETLPWERGTNHQEHILFWNDEDVETLLAGTMAYSEAVSLRDEVEHAAKVLDGIVGKTVRTFRGEGGDTTGFKWPWEVTLESTSPPSPVKGLPEAVRGAFVSLLTRAFQDGDGDEEKLVPMLDLLQHSDAPNVSHIMRKSDGCVEVRARRDLQPNEELFNQYRSELEETMP